MPAIIPCVPCCGQPQVTNVPGIAGEDGNGGTAGLNSYTVTTSDFVIPAVGATVAVNVAHALWMVKGQNVVVGTPGAGTDRANFLVVSINTPTNATLMYLGLSGDLSPANTIAAGGAVGPSGTQPTLSSLSVYAAGTAYQLTASSAKLTFGTTSPALVLNAPGTYLLLARVRYDYNAATFAAVRTVTSKLRRTNNTAADLANGSGQWKTQIITTLTYTARIHNLPPVIVTTANSDDAIELWGDVSVVPSAGSLDAVEAEIAALKIG